MQNDSTRMNTLAIVIGATGGIGNALMHALRQSGRYDDVIGLSRSGTPPLELTSEASIKASAAFVAEQGTPRLIVDATGVLQAAGSLKAEKSWRELDAEQMAQAFAVNAIGPALLMKHFLPLLPRDGNAVFATLSARVGSIGDNRLGGWYSYRASKAALNQLVRTAAIELRRRSPNAVCVALHPGTVDTGFKWPVREPTHPQSFKSTEKAKISSECEKLTPLWAVVQWRVVVFSIPATEPIFIVRSELKQSRKCKLMRFRQITPSAVVIPLKWFTALSTSRIRRYTARTTSLRTRALS